MRQTGKPTQYFSKRNPFLLILRVRLVYNLAEESTHKWERWGGWNKEQEDDESI